MITVPGELAYHPLVKRLDGVSVGGLIFIIFIVLLTSAIGVQLYMIWRKRRHF